MMSVYIIVQFKIIKIDDHHARSRLIGFPDGILKIPSVMCTCQCIFIKLIRITGQLINEFFASLRIDQGIHIQLLDHLHHVRFMINLHISCINLIQRIIHIFQFNLHFSLHCGFSGNTVFTAFFFFPEAVTFTAVRVSLKAIRKQYFQADHTHHIKDLPHYSHIVFRFLHCQIVFHFHLFNHLYHSFLTFTGIIPIRFLSLCHNMPYICKSSARLHDFF